MICSLKKKTTISTIRRLQLNLILTAGKAKFTFPVYTKISILSSIFSKRGEGIWQTESVELPLKLAEIRLN